MNALFTGNKDGLVNEGFLNLEARIEQITSHQETYIKYIQEDQNKAIAEAQEIAQQLIEHIVTLTTKMVDEITELGNKEINITKGNINAAYSLNQEIRLTKIIIETAQKYGSADECVFASRRFDASVKEIMTKLSSLEMCDQKCFSIDKHQEIHKLHRLCKVTFASGLKNELVDENATDTFLDDLKCHDFNEKIDSRTVHDLCTQYEASISKCNKEVQTLEIACASAPIVLADKLRLTHLPTPFQNTSKASIRPFMERSVQEPGSKFNVKSPNDLFSCFITAITILSDGKMLLADRWNRKMKLLSPEFVFLDECALSGCPIDVCVVEDDIYVCCSDEKKVFRFCIDGFGKLNQTGGYPTKFWPVSISHFDNNRVIILFLEQAECFDSKDAEDFQIEIRHGSKIDARLDYGLEDPLSCSGDEVDDHYYIDHIVWAKRILTLDDGTVVLAENDRISCYDNDEFEIGNREWYYKYYGSNPLINARGLASDSEGNVYICGSESNNIHQVSSQNYRHNRILIRDINRPYYVCVDSKRGRLIVGCNQDENIYVFDFL